VQASEHAPAVLFLVFNRPDATRRVLDAILAARPRRLYVAADGPRPSHARDAADCAAVREIINHVPATVDVRTRYRSHNLGCRAAVSEALDWFYEHEPEGVVLEDDCLPDPSFFRYSAALLDRYREQNEVFAIAGNGSHSIEIEREDSYRFSRYNHVWGWATWRRAWQNYDDEMSDWPRLRETSWLLQVGDGHHDFARFWKAAFDAAYLAEVDTWAYRWTYSCWRRGGLTALPMSNLVKNIGFDLGATHTADTENWLARLPLERMDCPLRHPERVERDVDLDRWIDLKYFGTKPSPVVRFRSGLGRLRRTFVKGA
jgi:hypothetical protein